MRQSSRCCSQARCEPNNTILIVSVNKLFIFLFFRILSPLHSVLHQNKTNKQNQLKYRKQNVHPLPPLSLELLYTASPTHLHTGCNGSVAQMSTEKPQKWLEMRTRSGCWSARTGNTGFQCSGWEGAWVKILGGCPGCSANAGHGRVCTCLWVPTVHLWPSCLIFANLQTYAVHSFTWQAGEEVYWRPQ